MQSLFVNYSLNVETSLDYGDLMGLATIMFGSVTMEELSFQMKTAMQEAVFFILTALGIMNMI